jgi:hypothetical protein
LRTSATGRPATASSWKTTRRKSTSTRSSRSFATPAALRDPRGAIANSPTTRVDASARPVAWRIRPWFSKVPAATSKGCETAPRRKPSGSAARFVISGASL